jgi:predicted transcriptional regulator YdeE
MSKIKINDIHLIGLSLKTTNEGGQSSIDCGNLWQEFEKGKYAETIPDKLSEEIYAVYHRYEGDHTKSFSYFIGCKAQSDTKAPQGLENLTIPSETYHKITAKGKMPDCIINAWKEIWITDIARSFQIDFEVYDERSQNWNDVEVDVYLSTK